MKTTEMHQELPEVSNYMIHLKSPYMQPKTLAMAIFQINMILFSTKSRSRNPLIPSLYKTFQYASSPPELRSTLTSMHPVPLSTRVSNRTTDGSVLTAEETERRRTGALDHSPPRNPLIDGRMFGDGIPLGGLAGLGASRNDSMARNRTTGNDGSSSKRNTLQNSGIADNIDPAHRTADRVIDKTSNTPVGRDTLAPSGRKKNPRKIDVRGGESKPKPG
ncbi:hypothetical protein CC78DRAFT_579724 [Lojkania enalia]|uniref:Uncharacterized protein n=1 Tax=Lojkania enalia TaxID=147567 RepID=A0A9P4K9F7_9PLEO|nr:hypothetical protein CC78DRAFT_579724 [Didymosphaeria enalia]